ncbi:MAG TPA: TonB-dependent receptor plug domain-containing protein, partial [Flavobacteriales bacterium]|nr:TonB-dependent receptor plug domain-containing protein [Flavobacteriales bacterium]
MARKAWCRILISALLLWATGQLHAQHTVHVLVVDSASAMPVIGAGAVVVGTDRSGTADLDGRLILRNVPGGTYVLRVAAMGYATREQRFALPADTVFTVRLASEAGELEEVVVSTTRTNSRIEDAPQKIEVLGAEELHEESSLKPGNIASMIGDISSVQVQQTSGVTGASAVRMQGLDGRYTLLLRDGMPAFGGLSGGFDLLRIPPLDLERVELLKGPSSTFNGGGAIAGAINFVSKAPADSLGGLVLLNRASLGETNVNVFASGPIGKAGFTLFAGSTGQDAVDVDGDGYSDLATIRTHVLHPEVFFAPWKHAQVRVGGVYQHDGRTGGDMAALDAPADTARYYLRTTGERSGATVQLEQLLDTTDRLIVKGAWSNYTQGDRTNLSAAARAQDNRY